MESVRDILERIERPVLFALRTPHRPVIGLGPGLRAMTDSLRRVLATGKRGDLEPFVKDLETSLSSLETLSSSTLQECLEHVLRAIHALREHLPEPSPARPGPPQAPADSRNAPPPDAEKSFGELSRPIRFVKGVGPRISSQLERKNLHTVEDLLYFLPRRYEDRRFVRKIADTRVGSKETVVAKIVHAEVKRYGRKSVLEAVFTDGSGSLTVKWFHGHAGHLRNLLRKDSRFILTGEISSFQLGKSMVHPDLEAIGDDEEDLLHFRRIVPIYSETEGLHQKNIRRIMKEVVLRYAPSVLSPIPDAISRSRGFLPIREAFEAVHFPPADSDVGRYNDASSRAHQRIVYDEFFFFQLGMALRKRGNLDQDGPTLKGKGPMLDEFHRILPFALTAAQKRVVAEIERDVSGGRPMSRLLQGDVGSGKTVVAMSALIMACASGFQAAIMAPTEILAAQHYRNIREWCRKLNLAVAILTGGMGAAAKKTVQEEIARGRIDVVVGTHALIQQETDFRNLGMAVIDEQHRFGVVQRAALREKGRNPHVLVMTATPIPRTLAMTLYGDLDVSVIDEMPPGKLSVATKVFYERHRDRVYEIVRRELAEGRQVFIVYPLVEESEALDLKDATRMAEHLAKDVFPDYPIGLVHGKMKETEKSAAMKAFGNGDIRILVATTVIEVGIDIPRASLMVIEHAERFGLSQLHQLRGRVGRSDIPSRCILMVQKATTDDSRRRLRIMELTNDGFRIAEEDLAIRGPGEFMGTRQSGIPDFRVASVIRDLKLLGDARTDAFSVIEEDPDLSKPENRLLRAVVLKRWEGRLELAKTG
ncbi:MAG: ATP-dependent DNA helicase RecG [Syntrophaceae bacterium PtaU1.Bin231]|nr:MAG: ATP-dependent DNA helicase RecG [Syntrophaceae bacterium PtaU1.Bin231]